MRIEEILEKKAINSNMVFTDKDQAIEGLVAFLCDTYGIEDKEVIVKGIKKREQLGSTGMGQGIAIPHCKHAAIDRLYLAVGICKEGVDFKALDGEKVHIFFMLIAPADSAGPHLKALARISRILRDEYFCRSLIGAKSEQMLYNIVVAEDSAN